MTVSDRWANSNQLQKVARFWAVSKSSKKVKYTCESGSFLRGLNKQFYAEDSDIKMHSQVCRI